MLPNTKEREKVVITVIVEHGDMLGKYAAHLREAGFRFQVSQLLDEGLALLRHFATPVVLIDVPQTLQECVESVKKVRELRPESYVILVTEQTDPILLERLFSSGVDFTFPRPVPWEKLPAAIQSALNAPPLRNRRPPPQSKEGALLDKQSKLMRTKQAAALESLLLRCKQHSPPLYEHMQRVQHYAKALAADLGLEKTQQFEIALAARLHDIGKLDVPAHILEKTTELTPQERESMRAHPVKGEEYVKPIVNLPRVLAAIRGHHERMDGKGYPDGLSGRALALEARIVSIADCFDALTALAPLDQEPLSIPQALEVLKGQGQGHLDSALVEEFVRLLSRRRDLLLQSSGKSVHVPVQPSLESELWLLEKKLTAHLDRY